jgi:hypothetical protein
VVAGPQPLPYADFTRAVALAAGLTPPRILPVPAGPLLAAASLARVIPGLPRVRPAEIRRLLEDKAFNIGPMADMLGFQPIPLPDGLRLTFPAVKEPSCPSSTASPIIRTT